MGKTHACVCGHEKIVHHSTYSPVPLNNSRVDVGGVVWGPVGYLIDEFQEWLGGWSPVSSLPADISFPGNGRLRLIDYRYVSCDMATRMVDPVKPVSIGEGP
jgi:hypothetical protein